MPALRVSQNKKNPFILKENNFSGRNLCEAHIKAKIVCENMTSQGQPVIADKISVII